MNDQTRPAPAIAPEQGGDVTEELAYRLRQQQLTAEFGLFALKTHDVQELLQEATRICAAGMHSSLCKVMRYQPAQGNFLLCAGVGWKPGYVGFAHAGADLESPAGYAFQTGIPVISNHLIKETRFRTPRILVDHGVKRAVNVLLRRGEEKFGVLEVDSPVEGRFTKADIAFMQGFANLLGVAIERQDSENALRVSDTSLRQALDYQEVISKEINHRVKNSLSIIAGLLNIQARASINPDVRRALDDAGSRVQTIASVHDQLWRADDIHHVDLSEFLSSFCKQFMEAGEGRTLRCEISPPMISPEDAVPLGLLVNELLTNVLKYTRPDESEDASLSIRVCDSGILRLEVRDHGPGLPPDFDTKHSKSMGMKLIARLGRQLGGQPEWHNAEPGTRFVLEFMLLGTVN
jgi:two-component sensor histidine kinase